MFAQRLRGNKDAVMSHPVWERVMDPGVRSLFAELRAGANADTAERAGVKHRALTNGRGRGFGEGAAANTCHLSLRQPNLPAASPNVPKLRLQTFKPL